MSYVDSDVTEKETNGHPIPSQGIGCFKNRLRDALSGRSLRAFSRECGLSEATLRSYLSGDTYPTLDRLEQIASACGIPSMDLAFGTQPQAASEDIYAYIPLYDARISQGHGSWSDGAKVLAMLAFTRYSLRKQGLKPSDLAAVRVDGDSNEPVLGDGDTVMVDLSRNVLQGEGFYVIRLDDLLFAKRLQRQIDGGVKVISANSAYEPMIVQPNRMDSLVIIGRVVWAGGWMI